MHQTPQQICREFLTGQRRKEALFSKGYDQQNRVNRRFFSGNQWYENTASGRPLVRLNVVRRIGEYKIGFVARRLYETAFVPAGVTLLKQDAVWKEEAVARLKNGEAALESMDPDRQATLLAEALGRYHTYMAGRLRFESKCEQLLRSAYITGNGFLYSYFDTADGAGELACEVLPGERLVLGENTAEQMEEQPFVIVAAERSAEEVRRRVEQTAGPHAAARVKGSGEGDTVTVYTKFYKQRPAVGPATVWCVQTTDRQTVREPFDTGLHRYPVSALAWQPSDTGIWSESEITGLIENQIAVNRLATANVWANISCGMPLMTVNGDTVAEEITNDPGQILRIYGTNEDVAGAVHFVAPNDCSASFRENADSLIRQTLSCNGAAGLLSRQGNLNSVLAVQNANATVRQELHGLCERYRAFLEDTARIWLDIWMGCYTDRSLCMEEAGERWYFPFRRAYSEQICLDVRVKEATVDDGETLI